MLKMFFYEKQMQAHSVYGKYLEVQLGLYENSTSCHQFQQKFNLIHYFELDSKFKILTNLFIL
jgi:hypothetical protein